MDLSGAQWRKSTRSQGTSNNCVEVAWSAAGVAVRDSKNLGPALGFTQAGWAAFIGGIKAGEVQ
ncbi:DUF397 domain-containing protein [Sphaerisporangium album]|uniref:DUF397 domain-containing protein n=1 Tax=Sphaerisporangium album TaxID=509200 RepID=A0A367F094_9ACTN|nr:DUF397 domain-containing protein [Sphaerisporangium album]RCG23379.1 DUF397 domain-containing protein [Sphaerisporangium album]